MLNHLRLSCVFYIYSLIDFFSSAVKFHHVVILLASKFTFYIIYDQYVRKSLWEMSIDKEQGITCMHCSKWSLSFTLVVALVMPHNLYGSSQILYCGETPHGIFLQNIKSWIFMLMKRHLVSCWECRKDEAFPLQKVKTEASFHRCWIKLQYYIWKIWLHNLTLVKMHWW